MTEPIDDQGRNPTQQRIDEDGPDARPVDAEWSGMSEVIPGDEDRDDDGAMEGALADDDEGGTGNDDGGPGSQNM